MAIRNPFLLALALILGGAATPPPCAAAADEFWSNVAPLMFSDVLVRPAMAPPKAPVFFENVAGPARVRVPPGTAPVLLMYTAPPSPAAASAVLLVNDPPVIVVAPLLQMAPPPKRPLPTSALF